MCECDFLVCVCVYKEKFHIKEKPNPINLSVFYSLSKLIIVFEFNS